MSASDVVEIRYRPTPAESRAAIVDDVRGSWIPAAIGAFMIGTACWGILDGDAIFWVGVALGLVVVSGLYAFPLAALVVNRRRDPAGRDHRLRWDAQGIDLVTSTTQTQVSWAAFDRVRDTRDAFLVGLGSRSYAVVPKRAFSDDERRDFLAIVGAHDKLDRPSEPRAWLIGVGLGLGGAIVYMAGVAAIVSGGS